MKYIFFLLVFAFCSVTNAQIIHFPDPNFKNALLNTICADSNGDGIHDRNADFNNDGEIDMNEALKIVHLRIDNRQITSLEGIQHFRNLNTLKCYNNNITSLNKINATNQPGLETINCNHNRIYQLNLENFPRLAFLSIESNGANIVRLHHLPKLKVIIGNSNDMKTLDMLDLPYLEDLYLNVNSLQNLNLNGLVNLKKLECQYNLFKVLDLTGLKNLRSVLSQYNKIEEVILDSLPNLESLILYKTKLKYLDIRNLINLKTLSCSFGEITSIRLENLPNLESFDCFSNQLVSLFIKSGSYFTKGLYFEKNPDLTYICTDEYNISKVKELASINGQVKCEINSYCSFTPGAKYYSFAGKSSFDSNRNGCDEQDYTISYLKYYINQNANIAGAYLANFAGTYSIPIQAGTYSITPSLENVEYFEINPSSFIVTFPSTSDTITQDFCITSKGIFRQTNITVIPLTPPARPGFDASYKIVWENVGNQIESGTLNFTYDEPLLDYISATQTPDQIEDGIVKWNFTNLHPFEKREIKVTLKVNRPTDTPAVNSGDKLYLVASILDNIFVLENTVIGSYDPNDKTCLQGDRIHPDMIGKYVDFLIRFENTGDYAAENVVIKDIIDISKFDISTLKITDASHEMYTRIEDNKVEFIFENIQLPFEDAYNDGHVAFKIKTLPTVVLGDSLKNLADIYFDYNFPIRTNETQSTIALPSFTFDIIPNINIYPNPVNDILYLETDDKWTKAEIYDISGMILRSVSLDSSSIDVSGLESGTYIMRIRNGDKVGRVKFVKI